MAHPLWENIFRKTRDEEEDLATILKRIPLFNNVNKQGLKKLEKIVHQRSYRRDETIFKQHELGLGMYIIRSGSVNIVYERSDGTTHQLAHLEHGDFFGEIALLIESPRSASAIASEPSELIGLFRPDLLDLVERDPRLGVKIILPLSLLLAERLKQTNEALSQAMHHEDPHDAPDAPP